MSKITGFMNKSDNPSWPPIQNSLIAIQKNTDDKIYLGKVIENKDGNYLSIVKVLNDMTYIDKLINENSELSQYNNGYLGLISSYAWNYVDESKLQAFMTEKPINNPIISNSCSADNDNEYNDNSLLNNKDELGMNSLFMEKDVNSKLTNINDKFRPLPQEIMTALKLKLKNSESVSEDDKKIVVNKTIAIKNLIESKDDEINEGRKIVDWIKDNLISTKFNNVNLFEDLKMVIFNGYVHITRRGINVEDVITPEIVPNLNFLRWQYMIPIDYDTLKFILFQNKYQKDIEKDKQTQKEAEKILSQEFLIAFQPDPIYQLWCLKRILIAWYADEILQKNIRKIKIIINQWRCKSDKSYNKQFGVQPSIIVYPRYGKDSARKVLTKLSDYFVLYDSTAWKCSKPSYFSKINNLIWYTNGSIDLKSYFRTVKNGFKQTVKNDVFNEQYNKLIEAEDLVYQNSNKK